MKKISLITKYVCQTPSSSQLLCKFSAQLGITHLAILFRECRLATKNFDQNTAFLAQGVMAAGTANWVRNFSYNCESQTSKEQGQAPEFSKLTQRHCSVVH